MPLTVQLDDATAAILRQLASTQNRAECEVVRDALAAYAGTGPRRLPRGTGKCHSGQSDVSVRARELLREAAKEGEWP
jgi:hypothetical protein